MIYVLATIQAVPGQSSALIEGARSCIDATRKEEGCLSYDYVQDTQDPNKLVVVERWSSRAALDAHLKTAHLAAWRQLRKPLVVSTKVEIIDPASVETV